VATVEPPEPPADDQAALAKEHLAKGRALKDARQFAEAAAELRKSIEADPKLVEAHWVLG
jgi:Tfp pilus assembly protein PilF